MIGYPDAPKAWWLTRGMGRISGVNLPRAVLEGWLPRSEVQVLVARCASCTRGSDCEAWLAQAVEPQQIPDFCPNQGALTALAG